MFAASVVPRASTQHPWYPLARRPRATSSALRWPARRSTIERAPEISLRKSVTPTAAYWASRRCAGSAMNAGDISPTDVESPMCTTDVHEVCGVAGGAGVGGSVVLVLVLVLVAVVVLLVVVV